MWLGKCKLNTVVVSSALSAVKRSVNIALSDRFLGFLFSFFFLFKLTPFLSKQATVCGRSAVAPNDLIAQRRPLDSRSRQAFSVLQSAFLQTRHAEPVLPFAFG